MIDLTQKKLTVRLKDHEPLRHILTGSEHYNVTDPGRVGGIERRLALRGADENQVYKQVERSNPDLWKLVTPRDYTAIGQYGNPKAASVGMIMAANFVKESRQTDANDPCSHAIYAAACRARLNDFPCFFVAPKLLHAMLLTDPPPKTEWTGLNLPYEAGYFVLPYGAMLHPEKKSPVAIIGWARLQPGEEIKLTDRFYPKWVNDREFFTCWTCIPGLDFTIFDSTMSAERSPYIGDWNPQDVSSIQGVYDAYGRLTEQNVIPISDDDNTFLHQMRMLTFNLLMCAEARPDLITYGTKAKTQYKSKAVLWHPNIIGAHWQERRETIESDPDRQKGTHASPRPHWKRGHYKRQPYGKGRLQIKTIWVEPYFVGLTKETQ